MTEMKICVEVGPPYRNRLIKEVVFTLHIAFPLINIAEVSLKLVKLRSMIAMRLYSIVFISLTSTILAAQTVKIGTINVYGNRNINTDTILQHAHIAEGDSISHTKLMNGTIENGILRIPGIAQARTSLVCCDKNGNYHLFVGVSENDSNVFYYRAAPTLRITLPDKYTNAHSQFLDRLSDAIQKGEAGESWNQGHSLIHYLPARKIQERYMIWADENFANLRKVLRSSAYEAQRATAVQIIAYHFDKSEVVPELMYAVIDESDEVRTNAIKALTVLAHYASEHPEKKIDIPYMPFVRLINSIVWSDRNKGLSVLLQLTRTRNPDMLNKLKEVSLPALKEMAVWKSEVHALPAFVILARIAGISEEKINSFTSGTNFAGEAMKLTTTMK
jgi:hypothetical protein